MCVLKCQTLAGVKRELLMYPIAYKIVKLTMLRYAQDNGLRSNRVSLLDTLRWLSMQLIGQRGVSVLIINPERPGRYQPRVIRIASDSRG